MATFTYRQLEAWRQAMDLVEACYLATAGFPREETYGLASQLRRAAVSIPSNIAEGHCRRTTAAYANHVSIALGSHGELATCLELALRLGFLSAERFLWLNGRPTRLAVCSTVCSHPLKGGSGTGAPQRDAD